MARKKTARGKKRVPKRERPDLPGYGLSESDKGLLSWSWAERRLRACRTYWFVSVRPDGTPHAMPLWGVWVDDAFYFSTGGQSRKARNLKHNAHCVVCTDRGEEAVVVEGRARKVTDKKLFARIARPYGRKYKPWKLDPELGPLFEVRPRIAYGLWEKRFTESMTRYRF